MAGPEIAIPLLLGIGGAAAGAVASKGAGAPPPVAIPQQAPPPSQPNSKPQKTGLQQSFMTSAAGAGAFPSAGGSSQKTLLGA